MTSEKINKTAEKETISNCKRAAGKGLSLSLSHSLLILGQTVISRLLPPSARHFVQELGKSTILRTGYNLKVASPLARISPSVLFFFSP